MIFKADLCAKVLAGEKTQTRRPRGGMAESSYVVGRTYAVQPGRGKHAVARIRVLSVTPAYASEISAADALAEGFSDVEAFRDRWIEMYPYARGIQDLVWRIEFELVT